MRVSGHVFIRLASAAAATVLLTGGTAYATSRAPGAAGSDATCSRSAASRDACVLQARASMGAGGHAGGRQSNHTTATAPSQTTGFGGKADRHGKNKTVNRNRATDGNVTNGPNVTATRDLNDRRSVVDLNDRSFLVVRDVDGRRVLVPRRNLVTNDLTRDLNDRRSVVDLNERSFFVVRDVDGRRVIVIRKNRM